MTRRAHLYDGLTAWTPTDPVEAEHHRRMLALLDTEAPFSRAQIDPGHFTASAFVLAPDADELLLILHGTLGRWLQPGGHVDPDDPDVEAAARREVAEEVGLSDLRVAQPGIFDVDIHPIPARKSEAAHEHFDVRFAWVAPHREVAAASDARDVRWVPLDAVDALESDASVTRAMAKLRRLGRQGQL